MKKLFALIALAALLLCACGQREKTPETAVSLWCLSEDPTAQALTVLAEEFNALPESTVKVDIRLFADENTMAELFNSLRPELLVCTAARAEKLSASGVLRETESFSALAAERVRQELLSSPIGGFFPMGAEVPMILSRDESLCGLGLSELFERAAEYAGEFMAVSSYAEVFVPCMAELGGAPERSITVLRGEESFRRVYNTLAEMAFSGKLRLTQRGAEAAVKGELACAVVGARELEKTETEGAYLGAFAGMTGESVYLTEIYGLALTAEGDGSAAGEFVRWLTEGERLGSELLRCGLVPATAYQTQVGNAAAALDKICREGSFTYVALSYPEQRAELDAEIPELLRGVY